MACKRKETSSAIPYLRIIRKGQGCVFASYFEHSVGILMEVRKRNGSTEIFMPEKVVVSAVKSGAPYSTAKKIAGSLSKRSESVLETTEIRDYVLSELRSRDAAAAADAWESYDREKKSK